MLILWNILILCEVELFVHTPCGSVFPLLKVTSQSESVCVEMAGTLSKYACTDPANLEVPLDDE